MDQPVFYITGFDAHYVPWSVKIGRVKSIGSFECPVHSSEKCDQLLHGHKQGLEHMAIWHLLQKWCAMNHRTEGRLVDRDGKRLEYEDIAREISFPGRAGTIATAIHRLRRIGWLGPVCKPGESPAQIEDQQKQPKSPAQIVADYPGGVIDEIYKTYPRKIGKQHALKAIRSALKKIAAKRDPPDDPAGWLILRVEEYAKSPAGTRGKFTPHPSTWFNGGRYDDDAAEWEDHGGAGAEVHGNQAAQPGGKPRPRLGRWPTTEASNV